MEFIMQSMKKGDRPIVTMTDEDSKERKLLVEAMPTTKISIFKN